MNAYPDATLAWDRTRVLARSLGVDLRRAVVDGWLTRRELDSLVDACAACANDSCNPDAHPASAAQPDLPGLCLTKSDLESLRL